MFEAIENTLDDSLADWLVMIPGERWVHSDHNTEAEAIAEAADANEAEATHFAMRGEGPFDF